MGNCASGLRKEVAKMNKELLHRMKKAICALFPEKMGGHLEVIENEIKIMLMEMVTDVMKECKENDTPEGKENHEEVSGVKKVDIL